MRPSDMVDDTSGTVERQPLACHDADFAGRVASDPTQQSVDFPLGDETGPRPPSPAFERSTTTTSCPASCKRLAANRPAIDPPTMTMRTYRRLERRATWIAVAIAANVPDRTATADQPPRAQTPVAAAEPTAPPTNIAPMKMVFSLDRASGRSA